MILGLRQCTSSELKPDNSALRSFDLHPSSGGNRNWLWLPVVGEAGAPRCPASTPATVSPRPAPVISRLSYY